ncbi:hypothetical protein HNQ91_003035 [Filimonas zeae]|uniref:Uncharacterized protein n=1 Tax=Filimonas zeae TaxID=1737353 RepID=A0A917MYI3_9BACT|nr:hypothetical protein [Filimonas zeae]MDR6339970.1 hypothetical protein [Filimonas zeae]GGH70518.1 hypothetical protein GCM10011379_28880 [Filimonas zeae]
MKISITGEYSTDTGFKSVLLRYDDAIKEYFASRNYGEGIIWISFCPVCRPVQLKQRVRMDHKEKVFDCDIMYNYNYWLKADVVSQEIDFFTGFRQIIPFLEKRKIKDFNVEAFKADLEAFLSEYI